MPLRALVDGQEVIAPALSRSAWDALRRAALSADGTLRLPCCQSRAFLRTSPRGLQHFYHAPGAPCDERGETLDHLYAKLAIAEGCRKASYTATLEHDGDGWRADVLASQKDIHVGFEIQWSRQTLAQTLARQRRYQASGVRGCWFFRIPPDGLRRTDDARLVQARIDLPIFLLQEDPSNRSCVYLNSRYYPLAEFVAALLESRIQFRSRGVPQRAPLTVRFFEITCRRCSRTSHAYCLDPPCWTTRCGLSVPWHRFPREIERQVLAFLLTDEGLAFNVGVVAASGDRHHIALRCFYCSAPFSRHAVERAEMAARDRGVWAGTLPFQVQIDPPRARQLPHWCFPGNGDFCDTWEGGTA